MENDNVFSELENDIISIFDINNNIVHEKVKASVQKDKIFITGKNIRIEEGYIIIRHLPNNSTEKYKVIDRGYYEGMMNIMPPHYECEVEKITLLNKDKNNTTTINANKIYVNSIDNSNNINNDVEIFNRMIQTIKDSNVQNQESIIKLVEELNTYRGKPEFKDKISSFLQNTANCSTIIAPFIPYLINML